MTRPSALTLFLGRPVIAYTIIAVTILVCYATWHDTALWPIAAVALCLMNRASSASLARIKYLRWRDDWNALSGAAAAREISPRRTGWTMRWIGGVATVLTLIALWLNSGDPTLRFAFDYLVLLLSCGGIIQWWIGRRQANQANSAANAQTVSVCIRGPLLPVPALGNAYRALPDYCQALLRQGASQAR